MNVQEAVDLSPLAEFAILVENQEVGEIALGGVLDDLLQVVGSPRVVVRVGDHREQVLQEPKHLTGGLAGRGDDDLGGHGMAEVVGELVLGVLLRHLLVARLHERLVLHALVLDSLGHLPRLGGFACREGALFVLLATHALIFLVERLGVAQLSVKLGARHLVLDAAGMLADGVHGALCPLQTFLAAVAAPLSVTTIIVVAP
mmetsp:Transcript_5425/g.13774  ORF Transcript_5425/g.13774 Transcript_5425/m.13774 type:complete len:202 (-) Transcript_5425:49-654(-)